MRPKKTIRRAGLTLVELLVVLVILAILTTVAVQSTAYLADQARYSSTIQTMQNLQNAIVGLPYQLNADGSILVNGFVADTGMLPPNGLSDLTTLPANFSTFSLFTPVVQSGAPNSTAPPILSPAGWNGPYIAPTVNGIPQTFLDGWGNPIIYDSTAGTLTSKGADGIADSSGGNLTGYDKDIIFTLPASSGIVQATIQVQDSPSSGGVTPLPRPPTATTDGTLTLYYIGPNTDTDSATNPLKELFAPITIGAANTIAITSTGMTVTTTTNTGTTPPTSIVLANATIGPRVLWVQATGGSSTKTSPYTRLMVRPATNTINLTLQ